MLSQTSQNSMNLESYSMRSQTSSVSSPEWTGSAPGSSYGPSKLALPAAALTHSLLLKSPEDVAAHPHTNGVKESKVKIVQAGDFEAERHYYPRVLNAQIHPLVASFFALGNERIVRRYAHLNPLVDGDKLLEILNYRPKYFAWAGCDLFNVTNAEGHRSMIVIETNSCPSGQKSMPLLSENDECGGYRVVLEHTFRGLLEQTNPDVGCLAVVYDKNPMEASGYAATMAEVMGEPVFLVEFYHTDPNPPVRWIDRLMQIRDDQGNWHPVRACFRYVTQKPWNRFPLYSRTLVLNSIVSCLAGGRNKAMAARAYEFYNAELAAEGTGLAIRMPDTIKNVSRNEIPLLVETMGGHAVIKVPYSNAGQGVYTITNKAELDAFMAIDHHYDKFIVQSLVGNASWSSISKSGKYFHVGTIPNRRSQTFVSDLRMMVAASTTGTGFRPVAIYARRARKPLVKNLADATDPSSWEMLGTNLSVKLSDDENGKPRWTSEAHRLLLMDRKDFNCLGVGIDDLIDGYVQTVLSVIAIDKLCERLMIENEVHIDLERETHDTSELWRHASVHDLRTYDCSKNARVETVHEFEQDGRKFVHEKVTRIDRQFDFALFESLNPDIALLQEILN